MRKMMLVFAVSLVALTACQGEAKEPESVEQIGTVDQKEKENKEVVEKQPENENVLVLNINGEEKEIDAVTESIGTGGAYSVKTVDGLPVSERAEGNFLHAYDGDLEGVSFKVYEDDMDKSRAEGSAQIEAMAYGAKEFPEVMDLADYPLLQKKYDFYMQSIRTDFNRYAFAKDNEERNKVLVVVMEIPTEIADEEMVALAEAMALSVEIKY